MTCFRFSFVTNLCLATVAAAGLATLLDCRIAAAQEAEVPPESAEPVGPPPEYPPEPAPSMDQGSETTAVEAAPVSAEVAPTLELPEAPAEPAAEPPADEKKFVVGVGMRTGLAYGLSGPTEQQLSLNDGLVDQVHARPFMSGTFNDHVSFFTQLEIGTPGVLGVSILDAVGQIKFVDELQLWVGQHIPANDRNNMNGPFFGNTWNFAIAVEEYPFDAGARDRGATLWGLIADGMLKYHASVVDLQPGAELQNARVAGRLTLHLLEPENFYYNSGTYFGSQDILAFGAVVQSQKGVTGLADSDFFGYSFDAMFEKNTGEAGTFTLEGGYWNYEGTGAGYVVNQGTADEGNGIAGPYPGTAYMGVASWLTPDKIGPGQLQPNFRVQYADWRTQERTVFDLGVAYVLDGFNHKYHLNYRHAVTDPVGGAKFTDDIIQVGLQYLMSN